MTACCDVGLDFGSARHCVRMPNYAETQVTEVHMTYNVMVPAHMLNSYLNKTRLSPLLSESQGRVKNFPVKALEHGEIWPGFSFLIKHKQAIKQMGSEIWNQGNWVPAESKHGTNKQRKLHGQKKRSPHSSCKSNIPSKWKSSSAFFFTILT